MTLEEAIELLVKHLIHLKNDNDPICFEATQLGIEALKRVKFRRDRLSWKFEPLLPGETVE